MKKNQVTTQVAVQCLAKELRENPELFEEWRRQIVDSMIESLEIDKLEPEMITWFIQTTKIGATNFLDTLKGIK